jgi:NADH-quinone oxidoreductase subunit A
MLDNYLPILIFIIVGILVGVGPLVMGYLLGTSPPGRGERLPL